MRATCIVWSARSNGSTAYLIHTLADGMRTAGISTTVHHIGEKDIRYCLGCKRCYEGGVCVQEDDVSGIVVDILASDYVAIASPSYWADVPGQLKTFFDRNTPYGDTNPNRIRRAEKPIRGIAIAVRAGIHAEENAHILNAIEHYYGHLGITPVKRISVCGVDSLHDLLDQHRDTIDAVYRMGAGIRAE